jgi:predicted acetyltransferase
MKICTYRAVPSGKTSCYASSVDCEADSLILVKPTEQAKDAVLAYRKEFTEPRDTHGTASLCAATTFKEWLQRVRNSENEETVEEGYVPSSTYLAVSISDNKLIGILSIRHRLNEALEIEGGHIGYSVRRSERRKGCGTQMLKQALAICQDMGITKVLLTCDKDNTGSVSVIRHNGGVLNAEFRTRDGVLAQRYWITLA